MNPEDIKSQPIPCRNPHYRFTASYDYEEYAICIMTEAEHDGKWTPIDYTHLDPSEVRAAAQLILMYPPETFLFGVATCACGELPMHTVYARSGKHRLCCRCYVNEGNPPADWHDDCMQAYAELKEKQKP